MELKISKEKTFHYFLLYLLLIWQDAGIKLYFGSSLVEMITLFVAGFYVFRYFRCRSKWLFLFASVLLCNVIVVRFLTNGVGLSYFLSALSGIAIASVAVTYNSKKFTYRYVHIVSFFAIISIILWLFTMIFPEIFQKISLLSYSPYGRRVYTSSKDFYLVSVNYYGGLLYVARIGNDLGRNNGIFNEPGLYQMVLNTALFFVMFYPKQCTKNLKEQIRLTYLLILTIVTCQSTTGYLSLIVILIVYMIVNKESRNRTKMAGLIMGAIALLTIDAFANGEASLFASVLQSKISITSSGIQFTGSGVYRADTIAIVLGAVATSPLGIGFDNFSHLITLAGKTSSDGTALMVALGSMGIQMLLILVIFVAFPMVKHRKPFLVFATALFMYINTTMGQSSVFYPALLVLCLVPDLSKERLITEERGQL